MNCAAFDQEDVDSMARSVALAEGKMADHGFRPADSRLLVQVEDEEDVTKGGIALPGGARERPQRVRILAVGPGTRIEGGQRAPVAFKPGDLVLAGGYAGYEVRLRGEALRIIDEGDVLGVLEA